MTYIVINGSEINSRKELYEALRMRYGVPDYTGENLDALHDVFSVAEITVEIQNFKKLRVHLGDYAEAFLEMLQDTASENSRFCIVTDIE